MLCFSQVYAIRCRPSLAAILCSTRIRTRTRTRTRTSQLTTAVKHTHKAEFIPKLTSKKQLPAELINARRLKFAGLAFSLASLGTALTVGIAEGVPLPVVPTWLLWGVTVVGAGSTALLWAATQQEVQVELHSGRLYIQWGSPSEGAPLAAESIQVKQTQDGRGNGAFAVAEIPRGTFIGVYEGDLLDEAAYWDRYPSGVSDYCIRIDREWSIDGCTRAQDTSTYSAVHMNHSSSRRNVVRSTSRKDKRVSFFAASDIKVGDELMHDYGSGYWKTRQEQLID